MVCSTSEGTARSYPMFGCGIWQASRLHTTAPKLILLLQVDEKQAPFMCLDLSFCHNLITKGFKIGENTKITLVKKIQYKKEEVEAAWPLGAAINMLNE